MLSRLRNIFRRKTYTYQLETVDVMNKKERFAYIVLVLSALFFLTRYVTWWFQPQHIPNNFSYLGTPFQYLDVFLFALLSFVVFVGAIQRIGSWFAIWHMKRPVPVEPQPHLRVAFLTCYVPGKEPIDLLEKTLRAMVAVRYPHDTWVLDEGNDSEVKALCERLGVKHFSRKGIAKYNQSEGLYRTKTKAGNHNAWRDKNDRNYDIVAQIDMDHVPNEDYFEKTLGYFRDERVGFIGMPQIYKNTDNWIAKGAAEQSYFFHGPMQQGYYGADMPFLIGTSHIYRTKAMDDIGGYAPTIVEDHLTGMNFFARKWKGVFAPYILAEGEGPINWVDYFNQQMRWSYGLFEILFKHTPKLLWKLSWRQQINYFLAQLYYFTGVAVVVGFVLTYLYLALGIRAASMDLVEWILHALPPFVIATLIQVYAHRFTIDPKKEPIFGFVGMFLNLGANIIYAIAFFNFLTGKKLRYKVTQKGSSAEQQQVPLVTFTPHIIVLVAMLASLILSFPMQHTAIQLRFWAVFNICTLSAIVLSTQVHTLIQRAKEITATLQQAFSIPIVRYSYNAAFASLLLLVTGTVYLYGSDIALAVTQIQKKVLVKEVSGKIQPPTDKAFLGLSLATHNDIDTLDNTERSVQKKFAVVGHYQAWGSSDNAFNVEYATNISKRGSIPLITWEPWKPVSGFDRSEQLVDQEDYRMNRISQGDYDTYITQYAEDVKSYGKPVMIRFAHEMNGNWYAWGSTFNTPEEYIAAWRHVHEIFVAQGTTNVTWIWAPNEIYHEKQVPYSDDILAFYPGDAYVDWVGLSSFNWANTYKQNVWADPKDLYTETISILRTLNKPMLIAETASADADKNGTQKAKWIEKLAVYMKENNDIKGVVWFNTVDNGVDWSLQSTLASIASFKASFDDYFSTQLTSTPSDCC